MGKEKECCIKCLWEVRGVLRSYLFKRRNVSSNSWETSHKPRVKLYFHDFFSLLVRSKEGYEIDK